MNIQLKSIVVYSALLSVSISVLFEMANAHAFSFLAFLEAKPVANSAYAFVSIVLLNSALVTRVLFPQSRRIRQAAILAAIVSFSFSCLILLSLSKDSLVGIGADLLPETTLVYVHSHVSLVSVLSFLISAVSVFGLFAGYRQSWGRITGFLLTASTLMNFIVFVGHIFSTPVLFGGPLKPMGFVTVLAILFHNIALLALNGKGFFPLRQLSGNTTRAVILRNILPLSVMVVLIYGWVLTFGPVYLRLHNAPLWSAVLLIATTGCIFIAGFKLSGNLSHHLDAIRAEKHKAERKLARNRERFDFILASIQEGIYDWDMRYNTFWWNRGGKMLTGNISAIPSSLHLWRERFIHPEDLDRVNEGFDSHISKGKHTWAGEYRVIREDGSVREIYEKAQIHRDRKSKVRRVVGSLFDITRLRSLEAERMQLAQVIDSTTDMVVIANQRGMIVYMNGAARVVFGENRYGNIREIHLNKASLPEDTPGFTDDIIPIALKSGSWRGETNVISKSGRRIPVSEVVLVRNFRDRERFITLILRDITDIKQTQRKLEKANEELRDSNKELEQFAYVAAHDLQEPVKAITGLMDLLDKAAPAKDGDEFRQIISYARQGAHRMKQLITNLLQFSLSAGKNQHGEWVGLDEIVQIVTQNLAQQIKESGAIIKVDGLCRVKANKVLMVSLVQNLINNALKYQGDRKPEILIQCREGKHRWKVSIIDNGIGIPAEHFQTIFKVFQRLHSQKEYAGTGIGLATCRKIVHAHKGNIWVESQVGRGSDFHFTLQK